MDDQMFKKNRAAAGEQLPEHSVTFLFSGTVKPKTADMDYPFCVNRNYYYMTGLDQPNQVYMLTKTGGETKEYLFIDRPDPYLERYSGKMPDKEEVKGLTGIETVEYNDRFDWHAGRLLSRSRVDCLLFDFHKRSLDDASFPENAMCERLIRVHPHLRVQSVSAIINNLRRIKSNQEVEWIKKAVEITGKGIFSILDHLRDGVNEGELEAHFNFARTSSGAKNNAFDPIIAGASRSNILHYSNNDQPLRDGDVVLLDLGAEYRYYAADISRTFPVGGVFTDIQKTVYNAVLFGQNQVFGYLAPGKPVEDTLRVAREAIGEKLMEAGLIASIEEMEEVLPHGVSHYVGLDCHDVGDRDVLAPGMVVTMEPGAYFPRLGFGVRIEDDVLITEDGAQYLSTGIPRTVEEIEAYMANRPSASKNDHLF